MKKLRITVLLFPVIVLFSLVAGCGGSKELNVSVVAKGFQHQFWMVVKQGADKAGTDLGVNVSFMGPEGESAQDAQVDLIDQELAKNPDALCLAALNTESVLPQLRTAKDKNIPVIGFDSGVPDAPAGHIAATASTDNEAAAAIAAQKLFELFRDDIGSRKMVFALLSPDTASASITARTRGFAQEMKRLVEDAGGTAAVIGGYPAINIGDAGSTDVVIDVTVGVTADITDMTNAANTVLAKENLSGIFCSNEGAVSGLLAALNSGSSIPEGVKVVGFDAGAGQKAAVKNGLFHGSITQDPFSIGYRAVELAVGAARGEAVSDVDTGAKWYDASNMDNADIRELLYD